MAPEVTSIPGIDTIRSLERNSQTGHFVGLHTRLLLGGVALSPTVTDVPSVKLANIASFEERVYTPFRSASTSERTTYWEQKSATATPQEKLTLWKQETVGLFQAQVNTELKERLSSLSRINGVHFDVFDQNEVEKLYARYFSGQKTESQVKQFVKDVLDSHTNNGVIDEQKLQQNRAAITWLSHIFGDQAADMITHLIQAEIESGDPTKKQTLVSQANVGNRVNILNTDEQRILTYISSEKVTPVEVPPPVAAQPQTHSTAPEASPPFPPEPSYADRQVDFTKATAESLRRCGIDVDAMTVSYLGEGANHKVYLCKQEGQPDQVLKIGKEKSVTTMTNNHVEEDANYALAKEFFPGFTLETRTLSDPTSDFYCILQDAVKGKPLTNKSAHEHPHIVQQMQDIVRMNNKLYQERKISLDFVGMPGFLSWFNRQKLKLLQRRSEFEVSNILIDELGNLKIVDYEFFDQSTQADAKTKFQGFWGLLVNRMAVRHYFNLDITKEYRMP